MEEVKVTLKINGDTITTTPIFGDDIKITESKEDNQIFRRQKIEGTFTFVNDDFDLIESCSDDITFTLAVYFGSSFLGSADFMKSDCTMNYDDKICSVKIITKDRYEKILAGLDNTYNLVSLAPETNALTLTKRPLLQIYIKGDSKITNTLGNMAFDVNASESAPNKTTAQIQACGFTFLYHYLAIVVKNVDSQVVPSIGGKYYGRWADNDSHIEREDGAYYFKYDLINFGGETYLGWFLFDSADNLVVPTGETSGLIYCAGSQDNEAPNLQLYAVLGSDYSEVSAGRCAFSNRFIYARLLSDFDGVRSGETKIAISAISDDIAEKTYNYKYAWTINWLNLGNNIKISFGVQDDPTEYGVDGDGKYFVKPTSVDTRTEFYPIGWSMWIPMSIWFENSYGVYGSLDASSDNIEYELPDAYPLYSAIQKLLEQIDPSVTYGDTITNSIFFANSYTSLGALNSIASPRTRNSQLYITPITNIKKTRYEQAAKKGDITLGQILEMLRKVYQCYWWISDGGNLCIEHISYFKKGGSYAVSEPTADADVTAMQCLPNKKQWSFGTNTLEFDRQKCPSRYEFMWASESTEQFNGYPITIEDKVASLDNKEDVAVANFTADIDYTIINPSAVSDDIYALLEADDSYKVAISEVRLNNQRPIYSMQNAFCSLLFAEKEYYKFDLGGWKAKCDGIYLDVADVRWFAVQKLVFPITVAQFHNPDIIRTGLGYGQLEKLELKVGALSANTELLMKGGRDYTEKISISTVPYAQGTAYLLTNNSENWLEIVYCLSLNDELGEVKKLTLAPTGANITGATGNGYPVILSARVGGGPYEITDTYKMWNSEMDVTNTFDYNDNSTSIVFQSNREEEDWAFVRIVANANLKITLTASTESGYDFGYANDTPCYTTAEASGAEHFLAGTATDSFYLYKGDIVYIGYVKDESVSANQDKITALIEEV